MMHLDAMVVGQFPGCVDAKGFERFFAAIEHHLGSQGTLIVPTFSYSFTKDEPFDVLRTPSDVGLLTEFFRSRPGVRRSMEPIFSVAASGARAAEIEALETTDCFGDDSVFAWLVHHGAKVVCVGCGLDRMTFFHFAEQAFPVTYRYKKQFSGSVVDAAGTTRERTISYFVRDLSVRSALDLTQFKLDALRIGLISVAAFGRCNGLALDARAMVQFTLDKLAANARYLVRPD